MLYSQSTSTVICNLMLYSQSTSTKILQSPKWLCNAHPIIWRMPVCMQKFIISHAENPQSQLRQPDHARAVYKSHQSGVTHFLQCQHLLLLVLLHSNTSIFMITWSHLQFGAHSERYSHAESVLKTGTCSCSANLWHLFLSSAASGARCSS